jgi:chromosome segregation ATPase
MEVADVLYGITMPRHGISRVLTLDPSDVEAKNKFAYEGTIDGVL